MRWLYVTFRIWRATATDSSGKRREIVFNGGEWLQANYLKNPWQSQSTALLIKRLLLPLPQSATPSSQTVGPFLSPWWGTISIKSRNSAHSDSHLPSPSDHCWTPSLKVAPLAIESLQPKKGVTMCRGFTQWLQHIYPNLPNCWAQREVTSLSSHPKRTFLFQRNFIHWTSDQIMCCGVAGHQRKLQSWPSIATLQVL